MRRHIMIEATRIISGGASHVSSLFEPDILATHQFCRIFQKKGPFEPEEKLMFAVLTDAVECFQKYLGSKSPRCRALFTQTEAWIRSTESRWPYSFEQICQVLNISPSYLRLGLMRWRLAHEGSKISRQRIRAPLRYQYRVKKQRANW
jgi:hypothetical protein